MTADEQKPHSFRCTDAEWEALQQIALKWSRQVQKQSGVGTWWKYNRSDVLRRLIEAAVDGEVELR